MYSCQGHLQNTFEKCVVLHSFGVVFLVDVQCATQSLFELDSDINAANKGTNQLCNLWLPDAVIKV